MLMKIRADWRAQLTALVKAKGGNRKQLSLGAGLNETWLRDVLDRDQEPGLAKAQQFSEKHGVSVDSWFLEPPEAPPPPPIPAETSAIDIRSMPRDMPVLGSALCGEDGLFELNGQTLDYLRRPPRLLGVRDAYAIYTNGDCMSPWREHGDPVYVHPHAPVRVNDYVVVQLNPESDGGPIAAYIKRLVRRTAVNLVLSQYNPKKEITLPTKRVGAIHHIMDWNELMSF